MVVRVGYMYYVYIVNQYNVADAEATADGRLGGNRYTQDFRANVRRNNNNNDIVQVTLALPDCIIQNT